MRKGHPKEVRTYKNKRSTSLIQRSPTLLLIHLLDNHIRIPRRRCTLLCLQLHSCLRKFQWVLCAMSTRHITPFVRSITLTEIKPSTPPATPPATKDTKAGVFLSCYVLVLYRSKRRECLHFRLKPSRRKKFKAEDRRRGCRSEDVPVPRKRLGN